MTDHKTALELTVDEITEAGYVTLCNCKISHQRDYMDTTANSIIVDVAEDGHLTGVEFLKIPFSADQFLEDLGEAKLTDADKENVMNTMRTKFWW